MLLKPKALVSMVLLRSMKRGNGGTMRVFLYNKYVNPDQYTNGLPSLRRLLPKEFRLVSDADLSRVYVAWSELYRGHTWVTPDAKTVEEFVSCVEFKPIPTGLVLGRYLLDKVGQVCRIVGSIFA